jgi:hypothetical protein
MGWLQRAADALEDALDWDDPGAEILWSGDVDDADMSVQLARFMEPLADLDPPWLYWVEQRLDGVGDLVVTTRGSKELPVVVRPGGRLRWDGRTCSAVHDG